MTEPISQAVTWALAAALCATAVLLLRQHGITRRQRARNAVLADDVRAREEELRHLVTVRLPALADHPGQAVPGVGPLDGRLAGTEFGKGLDEVLARFSGAVEHAQHRADQSAKAALKASMRSIQALANEQQLSISEMQERHDDPDVLRDLLEVDHTNAQFGRRAQAIAVLCGSWPGRQRATSPLVEVVRGATSRIRDYRRVRVHGQVDLAVESRAVEPVVLAIAELLDNAARHSQPDTTVEVGVQNVHNGACVIIDDAGVGMDAHTVQRATRLLAGEDEVDVTRLDDPPQFGFAVIGMLARRYGFTVSVDTRSPYGGVRAVALLPTALLTQLEPAAPEPRTAPAPVTATGPRPTTVEAAPADTTEGGLPKRRRRTPRRTAVPEPQPTAQAEEPPGRSPEENARIMGAFARGTRFGRAAGRILDEEEYVREPAPDRDAGPDAARDRDRDHDGGRDRDGSPGHAAAGDGAGDRPAPSAPHQNEGTPHA
ncbi:MULTISPECIES: ATP-binding protein [unclassified Streptomyces]|uniref:ATP-binding protein n=1 Tax=unclassified Streptomyces TaxID=2593676 RepID=UPI002E77D8ED|nr:MULTISPECIES: ATP-binding protein [unclassified Streptomyces]MEE1757936.1 ATP-binding protein [Streptomyces sp. SP18BB07]MEE1829754.1 ATP-binding protein [Streptomyces sp. SP17KL33]